MSEVSWAMIIIISSIVLYGFFPYIINIFTKRFGSFRDDRFASTLDKTDQGHEVMSYHQYERSGRGGGT